LGIRALIGLAAAVLASPLSGQITASIQGTVLDPSGAPVPAASLRVVETQTTAERSLESDGQGRYMVPGLPPGVYRIEVLAGGFRPERHEGLELTAGYSARLDFRLEIGESREAIEVRAESPLVSASPADWGGTLRRGELQSLPLNGRDAFDLMLQQPGVTAPANASRVSLAYGVGQRVAVNGARPKQNGFRLDGVQINDATGNVPASAAGRSLGIEGIAEIAVITSPFSAEYGRTAGGVVAAVTKSGTNQLHGSAYEYLRNSALDAKNFFDAPGEKIPPFRRNQFGGLLSGPVRKDRVFFVLNYEALRESQSRTSAVAVPTAGARLGRIPGAGGIVTEIAVAPQVRPYLELYPLPNGRDFGDGTGEYIAANPTSTHEDYGAGKVDAIVSPRVRLSARYTGDGAESLTSDPYALWDFLYTSDYHAIHTDTQFLQSPLSIHNFRLGFSRVHNGDVADSSRIPAALSFVPGAQMGTIQVTGLAELGGARARSQPQTQALHDLQGGYQASIIRGAHTLKTGGGFNRLRFDRTTGTLLVGTYAFESLTSFLQARARSGELVLPGANTDLEYRQEVYHLFVQDEIRLSRRLSLSAGARWEPYSALRETGDRAISLAMPIETARIGVSGPVYRNPSRANLAPRAGLAFDPSGSGRTVIRAGAGVFHEVLGSSLFSPARGFGPPNYRRVSVLKPPFPGLLEAAEASQALPSLDVVDFEILQPTVYQWQFQVHRQLTGSTVAEIGYAASRGTHLTGLVGSVNPARPETLADGRLFFPAGAARLNPAFDRVSLTRAQRMRRGLRFQIRYTWARTIDESSADVFRDYTSTDFVPNMFAYRTNRGLSDYHVAHVFGANWSWVLPSPAAPAARLAFGGWEVHGMFLAQTGSAFNPRTGFDRTRLLASGVTGDLGQRPDLAAPTAPAIPGGPDRYFDPTAFSLPAAGFFGNLGRNILIGPGLTTVDAALHKAFRIDERHSVQFRMEAFNLANHPNFQLPSALNLFASTGQRVGSAGRITGTTTSSRQLQVSLRWSF
jgi:hypothetical protein